jgi:hypothetical protein
MPSPKMNNNITIMFELFSQNAHTFYDNVANLLCREKESRHSASRIKKANEGLSPPPDLIFYSAFELLTGVSA